MGGGIILRYKFANIIVGYWDIRGVLRDTGYSTPPKNKPHYTNVYKTW